MDKRYKYVKEEKNLVVNKHTEITWGLQIQTILWDLDMSTRNGKQWVCLIWITNVRRNAGTRGLSHTDGQGINRCKSLEKQQDHIWENARPSNILEERKWVAGWYCDIDASACGPSKACADHHTARSIHPTVNRQWYRMLCVLEYERHRRPWRKSHAYIPGWLGQGTPHHIICNRHDL